jgi:MOSC domain-containing protein YiiM
MIRLVSIQIGLPQWYDAPSTSDGGEERWQTAFYKQPVSGPVVCRALGLEGDGVADRKNHGGGDKAVLGYSIDHFPFWSERMGLPTIPGGAFGENLSLAGQSETDVCIGDVWRFGDAELQVSQPRQPCFKLGRRWNRVQLPKEVIQEGFSGWYYRVLREGVMKAGDEPALLSRPHPDWTVERANRVLYRKPPDRESRSELAHLPELSLSWREQLLSP